MAEYLKIVLVLLLGIAMVQPVSSLTWGDDFNTNTSSQYWYLPSAFAWDTTNSVLVAQSLPNRNMTTPKIGFFTRGYRFTLNYTPKSIGSDYSMNIYGFAASDYGLHNTGNRYYVSIYQQNSTGVKSAVLNRVVAGSLVLLNDSPNDPSVNINQSYKLDIDFHPEYSLNQISIKVDEIERCSATDTTFSQGYAGIYARYGIFWYDTWTVNETAVANFTASPQLNATVILTQDGTNYNDTGVTYQWGFGDGSNSTAAHPAHTYATAGNYNITLTVSNVAGSNSTYHYYNSTGELIASFTPTGATYINSTTAIQFTDTTSDTPIAWNWSFRNATGNNTAIQFSSLKNPIWYPGRGNYTIHLNVSTALNYNNSPQTTWINVSDELPFQYPITEWCGIQNLYFSDVDSDVSPYGSLLNYATGGNERDENVTVAAGQPPKLIDAYLSPEGLPNSSTLYSGMRTYGMYGYVDSLSAPSYFTMNVSIRHQNGNFTNIYNITSTAISSLTPKLDQTVYVGTKNVTMNQSDRILIEIYGFTTRVSGTNVHFASGGTVSNSYVTSGYFACPPHSVSTPTATPTPVPTIPNLPVAQKPKWKLDDIPWWGWGILLVLFILWMGMRRRRR